jgi:hypothetical protein
MPRIPRKAMQKRVLADGNTQHGSAIRRGSPMSARDGLDAIEICRFTRPPYFAPIRNAAVDTQGGHGEPSTGPVWSITSDRVSTRLLATAGSDPSQATHVGRTMLQPQWRRLERVPVKFNRKRASRFFRTLPRRASMVTNRRAARRRSTAPPRGPFR